MINSSLVNLAIVANGKSKEDDGDDDSWTMNADQLRRTSGISYAETENGYMTNELFKSFIREFANKIAPKMERDESGNIKPHQCLLLADNPPCHQIDDEFSNEMTRMGIDFYVFPANSTHLLQPLDSVIFREFSREFDKCMNKVLQSIDHPTLTDILVIVSNAWQVSAILSRHPFAVDIPCLCRD